MPNMKQRSCVDFTGGLDSEVSQAIDEALRENKKSRGTREEVLILGAPGSGKTTLMRQLRIIYDPYTVREREDFKPYIRSSVLHVFRQLHSLLPVETPSILKIPGLDSSPTETLVLTEDIATLIRDWWSRSDIQNLSSDLSLDPSTTHLLDRILPIAAKDYLPSDLDILFCHSDPLPALAELTIPFSEETRYRPILNCVCVRQSLGSIHKWLPIFGEISHVIFVFNLNDYDDLEDTRKTFDLWEYIYSSRFTRFAHIYLIVNRPSTFASKLTNTHPTLNSIYPDADAAPDIAIAITPAAAQAFLLRRFSERDWSGRRRIPRWEVDLMDTEGVRVTMRNMMDELVQTRLVTVCGL
ncbi:G-protein alpha subunit [Favolaschia claudopus]|uniref:G-protein alpha subunit n=1 Tax=Favolaschia claudopus TaxID=2862362 RepID=A0AAW0CPK9_9AGAR